MPDLPAHDAPVQAEAHVEQGLHYLCYYCYCLAALSRECQVSLADPDTGSALWCVLGPGIGAVGAP